jgi:hypothetical protein
LMQVCVLCLEAVNHSAQRVGKGKVVPVKSKKLSP